MSPALSTQSYRGKAKMKADANPLKIVSVGTIFLPCFAILVFSLLMLRWDTAAPAYAYADPLAQNPSPTAANPLYSTAAVDVDSSSYTVGDSMTVTLSGFPANTSVSLTVESSDRSNSHSLNSVTTDATGASTTVHTVPAVRPGQSRSWPMPARSRQLPPALPSRRKLLHLHQHLRQPQHSRRCR